MSHAYEQSSTYSLHVNGQEVFVTKYYGYDYAHFSLGNGSSYFVITSLSQTASIKTYRISPLKYEIKGNINENILNFSVTDPKYLIVKIDDLYELMIVPDLLEYGAPNASSKGIINVVNQPYNADSTGKNLSKGIQQAIDDANQGGRPSIVFIPKGIYLIPNLYLKSDVNLYLEGGAVLRFTGNPTDYRADWYKLSMRMNITRWISTEYGTKNITVFGRGTLDGNGKYSVDHRIGMNILVPIDTRDFLCDGLLVRESGSWAVTPIRSRNLYLTNIKVFNRFDMGEDDGIDIMESQNVTVERAIAVALDDSFSAKTWTNTTDISQGWPGQPQILDGVLFDDCLAFTICYGFKIGQGVLQTQSEVVFQNSVVYDGAVGIGISHQYGSAAAINVTFQNIDIERLSSINSEHGTWLAWYVWSGSGLYGPLINITAKNITIRDKGQTFGVIRGLNSNSTIDKITLMNIRMPGSNKPAVNLEEMNIWNIGFLNNVTILPVYSPPVERKNLALNQRGTASSSEEDHNPQLIFDGDLETRWIAATTDSQWVQVDLGFYQPINRTRIFWEQAHSAVYSIQVSEDNINWKTVLETSQGMGGITVDNFTTIQARYVRLSIGKPTKNWPVSLWEIQIFGTSK
jgi:polygalacturonase